MNTILIIVGVGIIIYWFSKRRGNNLSIETVNADLANGALLIDVRSAAEYSSGHAKGSRNIPLQNLQSGTLPTKDKQQTVYVYCHSGARASRAKAILRQSGFSKVINIGGLTKWRNMGGAVTK